MFVRIVSVNLKPEAGPGYAQTIDQEVIPLMRKCAGFRDEIALVSTDGKKGIGISFWNRREDADVYSRDVFPKIVDALKKHTDGAPVVQNYDLTNSTAHAITTMRAGD